MDFNPATFLEKVKAQEGSAPTPTPAATTSGAKPSFDPSSFVQRAQISGNETPLSAGDKLDLVTSELDNPNLTPEQRKDAETRFMKTHAERTMSTSILKRAQEALPSVKQGAKAAGEMISGAIETGGKGILEYFGENPVKAAIAGLAQIPRGIVEMGRFGANVYAAGNEQAAMELARTTNNPGIANALAAEALTRYYLNKKFEEGADKYTEATYGKEMPASAKIGEFAGGMAAPGAEPIAKVTETVAKGLQKGAEFGVKAAQKVGGGALAALPVNLPKPVTQLLRKGVTEAIETHIDDLQRTFADEMQNLSRIRPDLTEEQVAKRLHTIASQIQSAQNWAAKTEAAKNLVGMAVETGFQIGTGAGGMGLLSGLAESRPGAKSAEAAAAGTAMGAAFGMLPKTLQVAEKLSDALDKAANNFYFRPGEAINKADLLLAAKNNLEGKETPAGTAPATGEIAIKVEPSIKPPQNAPTADQISAPLANLVKNVSYSGESAPVNPRWNRPDIASGNIIGQQGVTIREMPHEEGLRSTKILTSFERAQPSADRLKGDRVMGYGYNENTETLYVVFDGQTIHDNIGGRGVSQYLFGNITPEQYANFTKSPNKQSFINKDLLKVEDVNGVRIYTNPQELYAALQMQLGGKVQFPEFESLRSSRGGTSEGGTAPVAPTTPTASAPAGQEPPVLASPLQSEIGAGIQGITTQAQKAIEQNRQLLAQKGKALSGQTAEQGQKAENVAERQIRETGEEFGRELRTSERRAGEREQVLTELSDINKRLEEQRATEVAAEQETRAKQEQEAAGRQERTRQIFEEERAQKRAQAEDYASEIAAEIARISGIPYEQVVKERRFIKETEDAVTPDKWVKHLEDRLDAELDKQKAREPARELEESKRADIEAEYQKKVERASDVEAAMAERERELKSPTGVERLRKWYAGRERRAELRQQAKEEGRKSLSSFRKEQGVEFPPSEKTLEKENVAATETGQKEPSVPFEEATPVPQGMTVNDMKRMSSRMRAIDKELPSAGSGKTRINLLEERLELAAKMGDAKAEEALIKWNSGDSEFDLNKAIRDMVNRDGITSDPQHPLIGEIKNLRESGMNWGNVRKKGKSPDQYAESIKEKMDELGLTTEDQAGLTERDAIDMIDNAFRAPRRREPPVVGKPVVEAAQKSKPSGNEPPEAAPEPAKPAPTKPRTPTTRKPLETLAPKSPDLVRSKEITGGFGSTPKEEPAPTERKSLGSFAKSEQPASKKKTKPLEAEREASISGKPTDVGYHSGDLGYGQDTAAGRMGGRSTGHFGTGVYFTSSKELSSSGRTDRPVQQIDLSKYNLYKPSTNETAQILFDGLKSVNKYAGNLKNENALRDAVSTLSVELGMLKPEKADRLKSIIEKAAKDAETEVESKKARHSSDYIDSASTRVMKALGYDGIDVRGLSRFDNTMHGSVIYEKQL